MPVLVQGIKVAAKPLILLLVMPGDPSAASVMMPGHPDAFLLRHPSAGQPFSVLPVSLHPDISRRSGTFRFPIPGYPNSGNGLSINPEKARLAGRPPMARDYSSTAQFVFRHPGLFGSRYTAGMSKNSGYDECRANRIDNKYYLLHFLFILYYKLAPVAVI